MKILFGAWHTNGWGDQLSENETCFDGARFCASGKRRADSRQEKQVAKNCCGAIRLGKDVIAKFEGSLFPPLLENLQAIGRERLAKKIGLTAWHFVTERCPKSRLSWEQILESCKKCTPRAFAPNEPIVGKTAQLYRAVLSRTHWYC